ncbi:CBS domain-containing protein [Desulfosarcina sp.]|uniref:CBS domain-containing protein n=1 Tax=Desulfosarcina sp. TaxID=2027861 RepID=UPI0029B03270|nr:CBS domain-containing protein [Desulfosarcina sp.]MDX2453769.1 CBS domain-containing protein [Desulfosarcina sp.]MDX2491463.1 CBS domain-containing protein [Desulfosarcina sp.]
MIGKTNPGRRSLTIITSHVNADFDAMASMLAAQKLYPDALVVFPGSQEKNLRNFFIQSMVYLFNIAELGKIDFSAVTRLVLVDTRRKNRIGELCRVLDNPELEVHIYDHHPKHDDDIRADREYHMLTGATVTILSDILREKNIPITPEEATIMCLGIYEDTGSFSFPSTTEKDFIAAAYLLSRGANLNVISSMITREFNPEQIGLLNDMIQASRHYVIKGVDLVLTSVTTDNYFPDFSFLVQKMAKMENIDAIFALGQMENKVYVVARSRTDDVDVGDILDQIGGGGHPSAAAATVKGKTIAQTEQLLFKALYAKINPRRLARNLMSSPAIMANEETTCKEAKALVTRYNINALLVAESSPNAMGFTGYITRQVIEKALFHHLETIPIREYMSTEISHVHPDADVVEIQDKIIGNKQRILPVVEDGQVVGVITRTDLLNTLVQQNRPANQEFSILDDKSSNKRLRMVNNFLRERLSKHMMKTLVQLGETASQLDCSAYVVGGFVRDLFLYRKNEDIDVVIEGNGIAFAKTFAQAFGARTHTHQKFGTAVIIFPDGFKIDIASARMEYYQFPASLPVVEMSSIKMDMFRRDFTINTLAIQLNPGKFGRLIDFFSAQKDIKDKTLRVLHNLSFVEDPTRVFRALRFEQRFDFTIGKLTSSLIDNAVKMEFFKRLAGKRVYAELKLILKEENPAPTIIRLMDYNLLKVIHPGIIIESDLKHLLDTTKKVTDWHDLLFIDEPYERWAVFFMALIRHTDLQTTHEICQHLTIAPRYATMFGENRIHAAQQVTRLEWHKRISNADVYNLLKAFKTEVILYMMVCTGSEIAKKRISLYHTRLRNVAITVSGKDLLGMGLAPGPVFSKLLQALLEAKLNGLVKTHEDELAFIRSNMSKLKGRRSPA